MVQLQRVWNGDLQLGVVALSFAVQVDPDAGHGEGVSRLGLVDVGHRNALQKFNHKIQRRIQNNKKDVFI